MIRKQRTIKKEAVFAGAGIHTGTQSKIRVLPAEAGHGRVFRSGSALIPALAENVVKVERSTTLGKDGVLVGTVEHLLAALHGLDIDNCLIEIDGCEVPILDGSALPFCQAFLEAGIEELDEDIEAVELERPYFAASGQSLVLAMPDSVLTLEGAVEYDSPQVGFQRFRCSWWEDFTEHLAPARTFGFWGEVKELLARGLGQGADLSNALIFDKPGSDIEKILRFPDEPVRHKVLDLAGDLALLGKPLSASVLAIRAGHKLHVELVKKLSEAI